MLRPYKEKEEEQEEEEEEEEEEDQERKRTDSRWNIFTARKRAAAA